MVITAALIALLGSAPEPEAPDAPPIPAPEEPRSAEDLRTVASELFDDGRYEEAEAVLAAAYAVDPDPDLLFARAVVLKELGDCERAVELWTKYLESDPEAQGAAKAQRSIDECQPSPRADPTTPPEDEPPAPAEPAPPPPTPPTSSEGPPRPPPVRPRPWYRDPWGGALVGAGVVTGAVGGGLLGAAFARGAASDSAANERAFDQDVTVGTQLNRAGVALIAVGGALLVGGVVRYILVARR